MRYEDAGVSESSVKNLLDFIREYYPEGKEFIGPFSANVPLRNFLSEFKEPVLLLTTDGVGTKILVAKKFKKFDVIGQDCVAMNVNDIAAEGGKPLFFLDYLALSRLDLEEAKEIMKGVINALREARVLLVGGETAQLPDMFKEENFDVAGFAIGVKEKRKVDLKEGDTLLGLPSTGPHSNGFSLIRKIVDEGLANWDDKIGGSALSELVLKPTKIYSNLSYELFRDEIVKKAAHITGGGIPGNLSRILPPHLDAIIYKSNWEVPEVFKFLVERGRIPEEEAFGVFNMGIGFIFVLKKGKVEKARDFLKKRGENPIVLGELEPGSGVVKIL